MPHAEHVIISGKVSLYKVKAPFVESGKSVHGALEYDIASEHIKCHECGVFVACLANHIRYTHRITTRTYKLKHGLKLHSCLMGETARKIRSETALRNAASMSRAELIAKMTSMSACRSSRDTSNKDHSLHESRNSKGHCREQLLEKLSKLGKDLGRTPTEKEFSNSGVSQKSLRFHFGNVRSAMVIAGLSPNSPGASGISRRAKTTTDRLVVSLRIFFYNYKRIPRLSDVRRGLLTSAPRTYFDRFGSWGKAIAAAFTRKQLAKDQYWSKHLDEVY